MTFQFDQFAAAIRAGGEITARDTLALRQAIWSDGVLTQAEAQALFELNAMAKSKDPEWIAFFTEAVCDYVIDGSEPKGYVSEENALWVVEEIDSDGRVDSAGELELLVKLADESDRPAQCPQILCTRADRTDHHSGDGPTREGDKTPNVVTAAEAALLRRLIFAAGGFGPAMVSREEADMLFRIKDACLGNDNAPEWEKLFVQGVANHLQGFSAYAPLTRERAQQLEGFMRNSSPSIARFFARMGQLDLKGGLADLFRAPAASRDSMQKLKLQKRSPRLKRAGSMRVSPNAQASTAMSRRCSIFSPIKSRRPARGRPPRPPAIAPAPHRACAPRAGRNG